MQDAAIVAATLVENHGARTQALRRAGVFCAALAACGCGSEAPPASGAGGGAPGLTALLAEAEKLSAGGAVSRAAELLERHADALPVSDRAEAWSRAAVLQLEIEAVNRALSAAEKARAAGSTTQPTLHVLAESLRRLERGAEAEVVFADLLARAPDFYPGKLGLARLRQRTASAAEALPLFEAYLRDAPADDPQRSAARVEYGRALRSAGRYQSAADELAKLVEEDPGYSLYYSELAATLYRMRRRDEARFVEAMYRQLAEDDFDEYVQRKLRTVGREAIAFSQDGLNKERQFQYLDALLAHRRASALNPADSRIPAYYAALSLRLDRVAEARQAIAEGLRRGSKPLSGLLEARGQVELEIEDWSAAAASFRAALKAWKEEGGAAAGGVERGHADPGRASVQLARALFEAGDPDGASAAIDSAAQLAPFHPRVNFWRGRLALERGDAAAALRDFDEALAVESGASHDVLLWRGASLSRLGRREEAFQALFQAGRSQPAYLPLYPELLRAADDDQLPRVRELEAKARAYREQIRELRRQLDALALERSAPVYSELGQVYLTINDPRGSTFVLLASDIEPLNAALAEAAASQLRRNEQVFIRLRFLRRLLAANARSHKALHEIASIYVTLHVRLDEAAGFASTLHAIEPSAQSYLLLIQSTRLGGEAEKSAAFLREARARFPQDEALKALDRLPAGTGG